MIPCNISCSGLLWFYILSPSILRLLCFALQSHLWMSFLTNEKAFYLSYSFFLWCLDLLYGLFSSILRLLDIDCLSCWIMLVLMICSILQVSFLLAFLASGYVVSGKLCHLVVNSLIYSSILWYLDFWPWPMVKSSVVSFVILLLIFCSIALLYDT